MSAAPSRVPVERPFGSGTLPAADWGLACLLAVLTVLTRAPFRARLLPTWDGVQFALALTEYDIVKHQPHPPGYILYVAAARALQALIGEPTATLGWLAIGASALTVLLTYRLAWTLYGRTTALVATIGLVVSPLFWFYGVVGLSYTAEAALATLVATLAWSMRSGQPRSLVGSALALAVAGGVRQSILILLFPLWLGMAWTGFRRWRPVLGGCGVIAVASAAWLIPMVALTGGVSRYMGAALELYDSTVRATTIFGPGGPSAHWLVNVVGLGEAFALAAGVLLPVAVWLLIEGVRRVPRWGARAWFFAAWIVPALGVYALVHLGQHGYLLTVLPACYILMARRIVVTGSRLVPVVRRPLWRWALPVVLATALVLTHTAFFAMAESIDVAFPPASASWSARATASLRAFYRFRLWANTAGGLRKREDVIATYVDALRRGFDPADTVLVTELGNPRSYPWFRHVTYYLPEFPVYHLRVGGFSRGYLASPVLGGMAALGDAEIVLPPSTRRLVWVVDYWNPRVPRPAGLEERPLPHGRWLYVLDVDRRTVEHAGYRLTPLTAVARLR